MVQIQHKAINSLDSFIDYNPLWNLLPLSLILIYQFLFIFYGLDFTDSFFHINNYIKEGYDESFNTSLTFFSTKLGYYLSLLFGRSVLSFRMCNWVLNSIIILCPILLIDKSKYNHFFLLFFITSLLITPILGTNVLGYDTFSNLFLIISLVLFLKLKTRTSFYVLGAIGLTSALAIAVRLPNLIIIPIISLLLLIQCFTKGYNSASITKFILFYILTTALVFMIFVIWNYGSADIYIYDLLNQLKSKSGSSHSLGVLLKNYIRDLKTIVLYSIFLISLYLLNSNKIGSFNLRFLIKLISILIVIGFYYIYIGRTPYNWHLSLLLTSTLITYLILIIYENFKNIQNYLLLILAVVAFSFIPALGSDTGLLKMSRFIILLPALLLMVPLKNIRVIIIYLLILIPFTVFDRLAIIYEDEPIWELNENFRFQKLRYINTTTENVKYVNEVVQQYNSLRKLGHNIIFYGNKSHFFNYLLKDSEIIFSSFRMNLFDEVEIDKIKTLADEHANVFFIVNNHLRYNRESVLNSLDNSLLPLGYSRVDHLDFSFYISKKTHLND